MASAAPLSFRTNSFYVTISTFKIVKASKYIHSSFRFDGIHYHTDLDYRSISIAIGDTNQRPATKINGAGFSSARWLEKPKTVGYFSTMVASGHEKERPCFPRIFSHSQGICLGELHSSQQDRQTNVETLHRDLRAISGVISLPLKTL